jgi:hypothetical protein
VPVESSGGFRASIVGAAYFGSAVIAVFDRQLLTLTGT